MSEYTENTNYDLDELESLLFSEEYDESDGEDSWISQLIESDDTIASSAGDSDHAENEETKTEENVSTKEEPLEIEYNDEDPLQIDFTVRPSAVETMKRQFRTRMYGEQGKRALPEDRKRVFRNQLSMDGQGIRSDFNENAADKHKLTGPKEDVMLFRRKSRDVIGTSERKKTLFAQTEAALFGEFVQSSEFALKGQLKSVRIITDDILSGKKYESLMERSYTGENECKSGRKEEKDYSSEKREDKKQKSDKKENDGFVQEGFRNKRAPADRSSGEVPENRKNKLSQKRSLTIDINKKSPVFVSHRRMDLGYEGVSGKHHMDSGMEIGKKAMDARSEAGKKAKDTMMETGRKKKQEMW